MAKKRVFTDVELKEMGVRTWDAAIEAVEAGDKEKAKKLIKQVENHARRIHDNYLNWVADLMDYIYVHNGEEALYEVLRKSLEVFADRRHEAWLKADFRSRVAMQVETSRLHFEKLVVEEDDEKVCVRMDPCGSGQRLLESGAYDPPRNLSRVKAHPMTWGLPNFPIYCVHCPVGEILTIEKFGGLLRVIYPAEPPATQSCRFCIYKDPDAIPGEIFSRVGMEKGK